MEAYKTGIIDSIVEKSYKLLLNTTGFFFDGVSEKNMELNKLLKLYIEAYNTLT